MLELTPILFVGGLLSVVGVGLAGIFACRPSSRAVLRPEGKEVQTPEDQLAEEVLRLEAVFREHGKDEQEELERRVRTSLYRDQYENLAKMAPRASIVKIWRELEVAVLRRAAEELKTPPIPARVKCSDAWALLEYCNVIDETDVLLFEGLERVRNAAASMSPVSVEPMSAVAFLDVAAGLMDAMGGLETLSPGAVEEHRRREERGKVVEAFSVMPLTQKQKLVSGRKQGAVMLTPEVVKLKQRRRQAS